MADALRITRLRLQNWRNFREVDVELAMRTFLVGPNASGKSNFLDAIRFLRDLVTIGGGFQSAVEQRGGIAAIRCLAARRIPQIAIEIALGDDVEPNRWTYLLEFNLDKATKVALISREEVRGPGGFHLIRPDADDDSDRARLRQTYLEQVNANREFREIADFLETVSYLHIVPQLVREPERSVGVHDDPFGGDFLERIGGTRKRTREAHLRRISAALKVAVPQLESLEYIEEKGHPRLRGRYKHWRAQSAWQRDVDFSDGTLRLLGLLWALLDGHGPLLLEEPELSLHPEVVRYLAPMLYRMQRKTKRQVLISTHSPELLSDEGIGADETLLLTPSDEGTKIELAAGIDEVRAMLEAGLTVAEAVVPRTRPARADQLALFTAA